MKNKAKLTALLVLTTLVSGWALPSKDVKADYKETQERVNLVVTGSEVSVAQNASFNPMDLVVSGSFDTIEHSIVDTTKPGKTNVTFIATKGLETIKVSKVIEVKDGVAPVIEGEDELELRFESDFDILSAYTATDNIDKEVKLELVGEVNRKEAGEYTVVILAKDSSNNKVEKEVKIKVLEDPEVIARRERNEEYKGLVVEAENLNATYLSNTSVNEIQNMLDRVAYASQQDSDYATQLANLTSELRAKLARAEEYYKPAPQAAAQPATAATSSTPEATPTIKSNVYQGNYYAAGWCTWHVANRRADSGNPIPSFWGNAISWYGSAQAAGYGTGSTPVPGAIAYFPGANHVAYVEAVYDNGTILISEMGWNWTAYGYNTRVIPASSAAYIY